MTVGELLASATRAPGQLSVEIPDTWLQGRTAYGGLTTALAYEAARSVADDLPPLRSAQIAFVAPVRGAVEARATLLRRGRSTAFVETKLYDGADVVFSALFIFSAARESTIMLDAPPAPMLPAPDDAAERPTGKIPMSFLQQFDFRMAVEPRRGVPELLQWVRLRDRTGLESMTELLLIGDALPPGAMPLMSAYAPVSSINWHVNILTPQPTTDDGWWLLRATAQNAGGGLTSQAMSMWNKAGEAVVAGMQCMAIFG